MRWVANKKVEDAAIAAPPTHSMFQGLGESFSPVLRLGKRL